MSEIKIRFLKTFITSILLSILLASISKANVCSSDNWCWEGPLPESADFLSSVWGADENNVFAVGGSGTILHFNGTEWSAMFSGAIVGLSSIWGTSASDVYVVGGGGTILHYDGSSWLPMLSGTSRNLNGIWGSSSSNIFAVGESGTILHYNGLNWSYMYSGSTRHLWDVWGEAGEVLAVGDYGEILRYDGNDWIKETFDTENHLYGVWGSSINDIFAVGSTGATAHYDGVSWSYFATSLPSTFRAKDIWGSGVDDIFVVGSDWLTSNNIFHYDGISWSAVQSSTNTSLSGIWGSGNTDVFAVGAYSVRVLHYDGGSWEQMVAELSSANDIWGSSETDVYVVGNTVLHYDGTDWSEILFDGNISGRCIWGSSSNDVFIGGHREDLLHFDGTSWSTMSIPSGETIYIEGIWGSSSSNVFAVGFDHMGAGGVMLNYDGSSWSQITLPTTMFLYDVWGSDGNSIFAVGGNGTILHFNGVEWSTMVSGTTEELNAVWGTSQTDVFAVGRDGTVLHYDGISWTPMPLDSTDILLDVWGSGSNDVYVAGWGPNIFHYDGSHWSPLEVWPKDIINGIWGSGENNVYAVGQDGTIIHKYKHTIVSSVGEHGSIDPLGAISVYNGTKIEFELSPDNFFHVKDVKGTCEGVLSGNTFTTAPVTKDCTVSANFEINSYNVTPSVNWGNCTISPNSTQSVIYNTSTQFILTPADGYQIDSVWGTCGGVLSGNTFTTAPVTGDCTVSANFEINSYDVTPSVDGGNGTISPSSTQNVTYNLSTQFTLTPATGYHIDNILGTCGGVLAGNTFTTAPVTKDCTVSANFEINSYNVTPSVDGGNGTISPDSTQSVNHGDSISFILKPETNFHIDSIYSDCDIIVSGNTVTAVSVLKQCSVIAKFAIDKFNITAIADQYGDISPEGNLIVDYGEKITFMILPNMDYKINTVSGCGGVLSGNLYTTENITESCDVVATFVKYFPWPMFTPATTSMGN